MESELEIIKFFLNNLAFPQIMSWLEEKKLNLSHKLENIDNIFNEYKDIYYLLSDKNYNISNITFSKFLQLYYISNPHNKNLSLNNNE